jgi:hypothetical protein
MESLPKFRSTARSILGEVEWADDATGYLRCPAESKHTHPTHKHDCRVKIDGVPTVYCFHTSCGTEVETINRALRSAAGKPQIGGKVELKRRARTPEEIERERQRIICEQLKARSAASLGEILRRYELGPADFFEASKVRLLDDPAADWRLLLQLFKPDDVIWIGSKYDSCSDKAPQEKKESCRRHFRTAAEWLTESDPPEQFVCPCVFKPGTHSRCNEAVLLRRFLVIESDVLSKEPMSTVINWCGQFMRLRAIVDTGGKS